MRAQPPRNEPPVQRLRIRYAKRGRLRFTSHRDVSRALERAIVRARVPMAYSSGFNPHPRISYAGAAPTGAASEAEYLEIALAERVEPDDVRAALAAVMPPGLDIEEVAEAVAGTSLGDLLQASRWRVELGTGGDDDPAPADVAAAVAAFLAREEVEVERMTKKGLRRFDCRAAVVELTSVEGGPRPALDLLLRHGQPAVRPDDVVRALAAEAGWDPTPPALLTRESQGPFDEASGAVADPLAG